jgi:SMI1/KNR4 family protein SUKH-1
MRCGDALDDVLDAWRLSSALHTMGDPLDEDGLLAAEARLGRDLPTDLRRVYEFSDGFDGFDGNINIERALVAADFAEGLRDSGWDIAPELLVFGGDGSDEHWALWYPDGASPDDPTPVIEIGEIFDGGCLALLGSSLPRFLRMISGFHLAGRDNPAASDAIGLPQALRRDQDRLAPLVAWADPALPFAEPDPYVQRLTRADVERLIEALPRS